MILGNGKISDSPHRKGVRIFAHVSLVDLEEHLHGVVDVF